MADGVKVGDGFIDVEVDLDTNQLVKDWGRAMRQVQRQADQTYGQGYTQTVRRAIAETDRQFTAANNRHLSAFQRLQEQKQRALTDQANRERALEIALNRGKIELEKDITRNALREEQARLRAHRAAEAEKRRIEIDSMRRRRADIDRDTHSLGARIGRNLRGGIEGVMSLLPSRLEFLFTRTGSVAGTAFIVAFGVALTIGLPAIGAMAAGLFFAGFGFGGALAAAVVGAVNDPRVANAFSRLKQTFVDKVINAPETQKLGAILATQIDKVTSALNRWAPAINSILNAGAKFLGPITDGMIAFVDAVLPAFDRMMNSPFVANLIQITAEGLKKIGDAIAVSFDRFLKDPGAMRGAAKGLEDFFNLIAGGIKTLFDFIRFLSRMWDKLNTPDKSGKSPLDKFRETWRNLKEILDAIVNGPIMGTLRDLKKVFDDLKPAFDAVMGLFGKLGEWLKDPENENKLKTLVEIFIALKVAAWGYHAALKAVNAGQLLLTGGALFSGKGKDGKPSKTGQAKKMGAGGLIGGILNMFMGGDTMLGTGGAVLGGVLGSAGGPLGSIVGGFLGSVIGKGIDSLIKDWFPGFHSRMTKVWNDLLAGNFKSAWGTMKENAAIEFNTFKRFWDNSWGGLKHSVEVALSAVTGTAKTWWTNISGWWNSVVGTLGNVWATVWNNIVGFLKGKLAEMQGVINFGITWIKDRILGIIASLQISWSAAWNWIKDRLGGIIQTMQGYANTGITWIKDRILGIIQVLQVMWSGAWSWIRDRFGGIFEQIKSWANEKMTWVKDRILGIVAVLQVAWSGGWSWIRDRFGGIFEQIKGLATLGMTFVRDRIAGILNEVGKNWDAMWRGMLTLLGSIWGLIGKAVTDGINKVLSIIDGAKNIINKVLGAIGVPFRIPDIPKLSSGGGPGGGDTAGRRGGLQQFAAGGHVNGPGNERSDSILARLSKNEYIIRAKAAKSLGYDFLDHINAYGAAALNNSKSQKFAAGGRVGGANNGLLNEHQNHLHVAMKQGVAYILALARQSGLPFHPTSTFRPGDPLLHGKGLAVDFGGFNQDALASWFMSHANGVLEIIHRTLKRDYAVFVGGGGGGAGLLGGIFQWLGKGWKWLVDKMWAPAKNAFLGKIPGDMEKGPALQTLFGKGAMTGMLNSLLSMIKKEFDNAQKMMQAASLGGGGAQQWAGVASTALKMLGLPGNWLGPLLGRIAQESGGNPNAINLWDSNAKAGHPSIGLMQTIGPTFNAYKLPGFGNIRAPLDNILAGLRYIKARYGSIFNLPKGGYSEGGRVKLFDNGGAWPTGTYGFNASGHTEMVLNKDQQDALGGLDIDVNIHEDYIEAVLYRKGQEIARKVKAGRRVGY